MYLALFFFRKGEREERRRDDRATPRSVNLAKKQATQNQNQTPAPELRLLKNQNSPQKTPVPPHKDKKDSFIRFPIVLELYFGTPVVVFSYHLNAPRRMP